jgi:hypothetical protein
MLLENKQKTRQGKQRRWKQTSSEIRLFVSSEIYELSRNDFHLAFERETEEEAVG